MKSGLRQPAAFLPLALRSAALFAILCQFRLLAKDLADTAVFIPALLSAFGAAWALGKSRLRPPLALGILVLLPWAARCLAALPGLFAPGLHPGLDALILNLDRNSFVFLFPYYWAALSSYGSVRSGSFLRFDIPAASILLLGIFSLARTADIEAYRWPALTIALFGGILLLQILALMLSLPRKYSLGRGEALRGGAAFACLVLLAGILLIRPSQEGALDQGGGLLEPKLLSFDFSQFLRLESEISLNDDLAFIIRKESGDSHTLLRRFSLSGYSAKKGFFRHEIIDEAIHPQRLPPGKARLGGVAEGEQGRFSVSNQEYFLVNFDSSAFIAINQPVEITPFNSWDASSFSSAYSVQSYAGEALPFELIDASPVETGAAALGMGEEEYAFYTDYGGDQRLADYAQAIAGNIEVYWDKIQAIHNRLKYGDYSYSLKPGIAPDGDQLGYFLFDAKKGYCSYFAFSMTLLLRSLGIPSRVAVGFAMDNSLNAFDYYPVRSDMAHAWVEVFFPGYGWVEYDPTTPFLAEGEEFRFSEGTPAELFERLMKEILENRSRLSPKEAGDDKDIRTSLASLGRSAGRFLKAWGLWLILAALSIFFMILRLGFLLLSVLCRNPRKKAVLLWLHAQRRLRFGGMGRLDREGEAEWAKTLDEKFSLGAYPLYQCAAAARYAPEYDPADLAPLTECYALFSRRYGKAVPLSRRILAWLLPPLAMALKAVKTGPAKAALLLAVLFLLCPGGDRMGAQNSGGDNADALYNEAMIAQGNERWERAIELYNLGSRNHPDDIRFPWALGDLYYSRQLYGLAWDEYRKAEELNPWDASMLYRLSRTAGYLNQDEVSATYLERLLLLNPDDQDALEDLGWMYFKLHRPWEGEKLLLDAIDRLGDNMNFFMTLGTIYADMLSYENSKSWYLKAIESGENLAVREFTAVAHYNLSILESRFYNFAESFERTNASLAARARASGRLAKGELYLRRLELTRTFSEYQAAYEADTTPLSKLNMAQAYQIAGRLEEARLYAEDCLGSGDLSWMLHYGIDPVRYKRDLHDILHHTYEGLAKAQKFAVYKNFKETILGVFKGIRYRFKAAVHERLLRKYSLLAAASYGDGLSRPALEHPEALIQYYTAFKNYPSRARKYLQAAREIELPLIPKAGGSYDSEEGTLLKDTFLLRRALEQLDPLWERDLIAETYGELARRGRREEALDAAERLYALNRGALRQRGIRLPAEISIDTARLTGGQGGAERQLRKIISRIGVRAAGKNGEETERRFALNVILRPGEKGFLADCEIYDRGRGTSLFRREIPLPSLSAAELSAFAGTLGDGLFTGQ